MKSRRSVVVSSDQGQSLVELAIFIPILLLIIAGLLEVSNLVLASNRVETAARNAARYGAEGGADMGMEVTALNTVTQTLTTDPDRWDLWTIRGQVNVSGTGIIDWQFNHVYGNSQTQFYSDVSGREGAIQQQVLDHLQQDELGTPDQAAAAGVEFVGMFALHDVNSILNLDVFLRGLNSVRGFAVMRIASIPVADTTLGCNAYPMAVEEQILSLWPPDPVNNGPTKFPQPSEFTYPNPTLPPGQIPPGMPPERPKYGKFSPPSTPGVPLLSAKEGYIYRVFNGQGAGNFGWLAWNQYINQSAGGPSGTLVNAMRYPGMASIDYADHGDGGQVPPGYSWVVRGYLHVDVPADNELTIGDRIAAFTGSPNANALNMVLQEHVNAHYRGRTMRVVLWRREAGGYNFGGSGSTAWYRVTGFAVIRIHGYRLNQGGGPFNPSWVLAEFISFDTSCGQSPNP